MFLNKQIIILLFKKVNIKFAQGGTNLVLADIDLKSLESVKDEAKSVFGRIDILVNSAALWRCWAPFLETSTDE